MLPPDEKCPDTGNAPAQPVIHVQERPEELPAHLRHFYNWIYKMATRYGYCFAGNAYLVYSCHLKKDRVSKRTIQRWLATLEELGYIRRDNIAKNRPGTWERQITPLAASMIKGPPKRQPRARREGTSTSCDRTTMSSQISRRMSPQTASLPLKSYIKRNIAKDVAKRGSADKAVTDPCHATVVAKLVQNELDPAVAERLVMTHGPEACECQIMALPYRQPNPNLNPAGLLRRSIEYNDGEGYPLPLPVVRTRQMEQRKRKKAESDAIRRAECKRQEEEKAVQRAADDAALAALSESARQSLQERAVERIIARGDVWGPYIRKRIGTSPLGFGANLQIRNTMLQLLKEEGC